MNMQTNRRSFLGALAALPVVGAAPDPAGGRAGGRPIPAQTMICEQDGVTAIGRIWLDGAHRRCTLCPACGAEPIPGVAGAAICLIQTDERVEDDEADLYSLATADVRGGTPRPMLDLVL